MLTENQKNRLKSLITARVEDLKCPICQNKNFIMSDGYFNNNLQSDMDTYSIGGNTIPAIGIICDHCGYISQHALRILGSI